ncbi:MAG: bifunctional 4-hydroxy-3-methylbut-2-enyl diphosphate reductase/30S ribosomal protein S1 [Bacillota bacterium]|nr:bifunctional 4-hydroxy-3-methylbut-2-enyl diphosphate reductase/30S ribosomal protein S1 [Bacillota bacterium]
MVNIILSEAAGFCFGVRRAVDCAFKIGQASDKIINTYGELIHNSNEIERLKKSNIVPVEFADQIEGEKIIIRTHGVGREVIELFKKQGLEIIDLTCPFVKKIHAIADKYSRMGYLVVIVGDEDHPEVKGIRGWTNGNCVVVTPQNMTEYTNKLTHHELCVVSQTTIDRKSWETVVEYLQNTFADSGHDLIVFDTICSATNERQNAAVRLAKKADCMLVIGGRHSSNTKKFFQVCSEVCKNTWHIEDANEIPNNLLEFLKIDKSITIGITAGASTPDRIIKEVIKTMSDKENLNNQEEQSFAEMFEQSEQAQVSLATGETKVGRVVKVTPTEVVVDLDFKFEGVIKLEDLTDDPEVVPSDICKVGDEIEVFIIRVNDSEGIVSLSKKKLEQAKNWITLTNAFDTQEILTGKVVDILQSGVIVFTNGNKVFVPASQASERYLADLSTLKGQEVSLRIIDVNERRHKVVGSIKKVAKEVSQKIKDEFFAKVNVGDKIEGTVKSITDFGAFVDVGGVDGLVHVTELSWKKGISPKDIVKVGDKLNVYIKSIDNEKGKISLGYKTEEDNPWIKFMANHTVGDIVNGTVVRLVPFGAFVDIDGIDGLIHISELSWKPIKHPSEVLKEGQVVEVTIKDIDAEKNKISLGYKKIEDNPWEIFKSKYSVGDVVKCKIVRIVAFGAFAEIVDGVDGLIHISQIVPDRRINSVTEVLKIGDEVDAKIIDIKLESGKVSLSIKALAEPEAATEEAPIEVEEEEVIPAEESGKTAMEAAMEAAEANNTAE